MREREDLCGVGKGDGALSGGVKCVEEVHEEGDGAELGVAAAAGDVGDEETHASG